jgi:hypothetical protein
VPRRSPTAFERLAARITHLSYYVDRLFAKFERARALLILAFGSDAFFEAHQDVYFEQMGERAFMKNRVHDWERHVIDKFFPRPPARVLVGGAGLGREAFGLAEMGYSVAAFEPIPQLVTDLRAAARQASAAVEAYRGSYQDLPIVEGEGGVRIDLSAQPPFDAAIIGWGSFGQLVADSERTDTLRRFAAITRGPIVVSFYATFQHHDPPGGGRVRQWLRRRAARRGTARFLIRSGFNRLLTAEEMEQAAKEAGLSVLELHCRFDAQPYAVLTR